MQQERREAPLAGRHAQGVAGCQPVGEVLTRAAVANDLQPRQQALAPRVPVDAVVIQGAQTLQQAGPKLRRALREPLADDAPQDGQGGRGGDRVAGVGVAVQEDAAVLKERVPDDGER